MTKLTFTDNWLNAQSPLSLLFPKNPNRTILRFEHQWVGGSSPVAIEFPKNPNRVELRFSETWGNFRSPIKLRFEGELPPKPPIRDGGLGIDLVMPCLRPLQAETEVIISNQTDKVGNAYSLDWLTHTVTEQQNRTAWRIGAQQSVSKFLLLDTGKNIQQQHAFAWLSPLIHQRSILLNCFSYKASETCLNSPWAFHAAYQLDTNISFNSDDSLSSIFALRYSATGSDIYQQLVAAWAPHKAMWICSTKYRPPAVGLLSIRFSESAITDAQSPIILRFTESDKYCYFDDGGGLIDAHPPLPVLDFKIPIEPQLKRSYLMQPQISCIRVSDGLAVVLKSVSISQSRSQWSSSGNMAFSCRVDAERAANELLKITINGYDFYLWCEIPSESKAFGMSRYSASGRGRLAELSAPYVKAINYVNTQARSFMGLMGDIIENTGWTLASEITDFNVPANAFSYAAKTPAEALSMMATAIGAMLDIDNETKTITVIPQWPTVPWGVESAISDVILHDAVILEFTEKHVIRPAANAVFVRGEQQGVAVKVKRTGSAGDNFAADIVDKLITDNQAARMRGTAELANAGNKVQNTIRTKVMADLPPMRPGMLIGVRKGSEVFKSVCDAFTISASVNDSTGAVTVDQNITLLRNEVTA